jgi:methyltransferase
MVTSRALYLGFLALLALERLFELRLSRHNVRAALARGGIEVGARHFRAMAALHTAFLASCALEVTLLGRPFPGAAGFAALATALLAQALRYWAIGALKERWSVRVIAVPGDAPVTSGPYRFVRHPNYVAVALEMISVPLVHGAFLTAAVFSLANAVLLAIRIPAEERALGEAWARAFQGKPRFLPGGLRG